MIITGRFTRLSWLLPIEAGDVLSNCLYSAQQKYAEAKESNPSAQLSHHLIWSKDGIWITQGRNFQNLACMRITWSDYERWYFQGFDPRGSDSVCYSSLCKMKLSLLTHDTHWCVGTEWMCILISQMSAFDSKWTLEALKSYSAAINKCRDAVLLIE